MAAAVPPGRGGGPLSVPAFIIGGGRITAIDAIVDPAKLARMDLPETEEGPPPLQ